MCGLTAAQATATGKIADSSRIARSMSTILQLSEKAPEEIENDGTGASRKLRVQYNRNGDQMSENEWIDLRFSGSTLQMWESQVQHEGAVPF